jgi:methionyl-tRNA synthetase
MGLEEQTLERPSDHCEQCGARLTPDELAATVEIGGPSLCKVHAAEVVEDLDDEQDQP